MSNVYAGSQVSDYYLLVTNKPHNYAASRYSAHSLFYLLVANKPQIAGRGRGVARTDFHRFPPLLTKP